MTDDSWVVREHPERPGHLQVHPDFRLDHCPFRDDPRYLEREPEAIAGAIEVADHSELTLFVESPIKIAEGSGLIYLGPDPEDVVHSWMRTFCSNVDRRTRSIHIELRGQRDENQAGLDAWAGGV